MADLNPADARARPRTDDGVKRHLAVPGVDQTLAAVASALHECGVVDAVFPTEPLAQPDPLQIGAKQNDDWERVIERPMRLPCRTGLSDKLMSNDQRFLIMGDPGFTADRYPDVSGKVWRAAVGDVSNVSAAGSPRTPASSSPSPSQMPSSTLMGWLQRPPIS